MNLNRACQRIRWAGLVQAGSAVSVMLCLLCMISQAQNAMAGHPAPVTGYSLTGIKPAILLADTSEDSANSVYYAPRISTFERRSYFMFGTALVFGAGFSDALKQAYEPDYDISPGLGGMRIDLGVGIRLSRGVFLIPHVQTLVYLVKFKQYLGGIPVQEHYEASLISLPGVAGRYAFGHGEAAFYVQADMGYPFWVSGLDRLDAEFRSPMFGVDFGVMFGGTEFEMGYESIPCRVLITSDFGFPIPRSSNFGGLSLVFRRRFQF